MRKHLSEVIVGIGILASVVTFLWPVRPTFIHCPGIVTVRDGEGPSQRFFFRDNNLRISTLREAGLLEEGRGSGAVLESTCCGRTGLKSLGCCVDTRVLVFTPKEAVELGDARVSQLINLLLDNPW